MKTSSSRGLMLSMPCGYDTATGELVRFIDAKQNSDNLIAIDKLSEQQKQELTIACINHGYWEDIVYEEKVITVTQAIQYVEQK